MSETFISQAERIARQKFIDDAQAVWGSYQVPLRCINCKHWVSLAGKESYGVCSAIRSAENGHDVPDNGSAIAYSDVPGHVPADLLTHAEFGCILFKP